MIRPGTLAQVLQRVRDGDKLWICLAGFLDAFYGADQTGRVTRIQDDPGLVAEATTNALFGAIGEHLSIRWNLGLAPEWTDQPTRFLDRPFFLGGERMKGFLLAESPSAFRRRFIFAEAEPLRRISMPRDGRWWAYETIRSGLQPTEQERAQLAQEAQSRAG